MRATWKGKRASVRQWVLITNFTPVKRFLKISSGGVEGLALFMPNGSGGWLPGVGIGAGEHNHKTDEMTQAGGGKIDCGVFWRGVRGD